MNRAVIPVLDYARSLGSDIRVVSVDLEPEETTQMKARWWQNLLHNQRALLLKPGVIVAAVPYHLEG